MEYTLTGEMQAVLDDLKSGGKRLHLINGGAGTGKSTFLKFLDRKLRPHVAIVAPTGIAALNIGGQTIHSFFKLPPPGSNSISDEYARFKRRLQSFALSHHR
jgi:ATP-dependent DNA helicase PIF1